MKRYCEIFFFLQDVNLCMAGPKYIAPKIPTHNMSPPSYHHLQVTDKVPSQICLLSCCGVEGRGSEKPL